MSPEVDRIVLHELCPACGQPLTTLVAERRIVCENASCSDPGVTTEILAFSLEMMSSDWDIHMPPWLDPSDAPFSAEAVELLRQQRVRDGYEPSTTTAIVGAWRDRADALIRRWEGAVNGR